MRRIDYIVIHCSATREGQYFDSTDIDLWHKNRGWKGIGYHYVITLDGQREEGRKEEEVGAHVYGHNKNSIGVCYIGGLDKSGKAKDTRTPEQIYALKVLLYELKIKYPDAEIVGHRDLSPDANGDGQVTREEWLKECPSFDAREEYKDITITNLKKDLHGLVKWLVKPFWRWN